MTNRFARTICMAAVLTLAAGAARAQDPREPKARAEMDRAAILQDSGELEKALEAYRKANEILPGYNVLWHIAQLEAELGMFPEARETYRRYLEEGTEKIPVSRAARARQEIARFDDMLGTIRVISEVDGAEVFVDGRSVGTTPLSEPLAVAAGAREVVVRSGRKTLLRETVEVGRGGVESLVEVRAGVFVDDGGKSGRSGREGPDGGGRVLTWVALGVGGAALVAGGITGGVVLSKAGDLEDGCPDKRCPESKWSTMDSASNLATATNVLLGVGAAAVFTGVLLYFIEPKIGGEKEIAVAPTATESGAGVALTGRF